jgi:hypothetical protein
MQLFSKILEQRGFLLLTMILYFRGFNANAIAWIHGFGHSVHLKNSYFCSLKSMAVARDY